MSTEGHDPDPERVRDIIARASCKPIADIDANLTDQGVKSIDMLRIVGKIEVELDVEFDERHLTPQNFASVRSICAAVVQARLKGD